MAKSWNRAKGKPVKPSFLLEVMALEILRPPFGGDFPYEFMAFFATAADRIGETWPDPAGLGPPVSDSMNATEIAAARRALTEAHYMMREAIELSRSGQNGAALRKYRDLFGDFFPYRSSPMTDPTGRSFLSYRRLRSDEAALLIAAQHDHGIPTWQDVRDLGSVPTEDEIRRTLADPATASAVLFITPEVETSAVIRNVEIPKVIQRVEVGDGFFVVPIAAGGLDYATAASISSNNLSAQNLADWNMHKAAGPTLSPEEAARVAAAY